MDQVQKRKKQKDKRSFLGGIVGGIKCFLFGEDCKLIEHLKVCHVEDGQCYSGQETMDLTFQEIICHLEF